MTAKKNKLSATCWCFILGIFGHAPVEARKLHNVNHVSNHLCFVRTRYIVTVTQLELDKEGQASFIVYTEESGMIRGILEHSDN